MHAWFAAGHGAFTPAQLAVIDDILDGENVLLSAPTGSGKTLAAILPVLSGLAGRLRAGEPGERNRIDVLYVSPLRALNNDVAKNLVAPVEALSDVLVAAGLSDAIRIGVRSGDTPQNERQKQARKPPHILVTTPESLAIMLASPRMADNLCGVRSVIVDEAHAFLESKRGTHLTLALERLSHLIKRTGGPDPQRIGLSATIHPIEVAAGFLFGDRDGVAAAATGDKPLVISIATPVPDILHTTGTRMRAGTLELVDAAVAAQGSTLVFANTRYGTEALVSALESARLARDGNDAGPATVGAHHGSMARERRLDVEDRLKQGGLKGVVTSASLELGIDVGALDLVIQLGSPKGVSRLLQRVGRSGHRPGEPARATLIANDRDDLMECVALAHLAREGRLEHIRPPTLALDVLVQHILGLVLEDGSMTPDRAFAITRRARPYRDLARGIFDDVVRYLAGQRPDGSEGWTARIRIDSGTLRMTPAGRLSRATYMLNQGAIPSEGKIRVEEGDTFIGEVEEDFASRLDPGEVFVLAGHTWRVTDTTTGRVMVQSAAGSQPTVPRWSGERMGLAPDVAAAIRELRFTIGRELDGTAPETLARLLAKHYHVSLELASILVRYHSDQQRFGALPGRDECVVEEFLDDEGYRILAFHSLLGRRANDALARVVAHRLAASRGTRIGTLVSDYAFALRMPRALRVRDKDVKELLRADVEAEALRSLNRTELHVRRFRHVAERAFLVLRRDPVAMGNAMYPPRRTSPERLLNALLDSERDHIVLAETARELLHDALDVDTAHAFAASIVEGRTRIRIIRGKPCASPFAHHLLAQGLEDAVGGDDRGALLRDLHDRVQLALMARAPEVP